MVVDSEGVAVPDRRMAVGMAMGLRALPSFMLVLVMFVMDMHDVVDEGGVLVLDFDRIVGGP